MLAVFKHELSLYYHSMTAYVFAAFLLVFTGIGALLYNINASVANFEYVLNFISVVFIIIVPILTMRILADEKKQRTDQLLYSLPISSTDIIVGKFMSLAVVFLVPIAIICFYPILFSRFGDVYLPTSYSALFAFYLLGLALMSIGMFISSLTESQGMAAGICVVATLFNYYSTTLADHVAATAIGSLISLIVIFVLLGFLIRCLTKSDILGIVFEVVTCLITLIVYFADSSKLEGLLPNIMSRISLFDRFTVFVNGIFDLTGVVYYLSVMVLFLFLCVLSMDKRRYNG